MYKRICQFNILVAALLLLGAGFAPAQDMPLESEALIGVIPGTDMTRDEFRARARVQLTAIALNALTYRLLNGEYPESYPLLMSSPSWNIAPQNMFGGGKVRSIFFEPGPEHMTTQPSIGLPYQPIELTPPPPPPTPQGPIDPNDPESFGQVIEMMGDPVFSDAVRVDPMQVENTSPGDVFYYVVDNMIQLIMYAADGTYEEHVDMVPNVLWTNKLDLKDAQYWPDDILGAQVMYFLDELLPQHYNHVRFMADEMPLTTRAMKLLNTQDRLDIAAELDLLIINPFSREEISQVQTFIRGELVEPDPNSPTPVFMCLAGNRVMSRMMLFDARLSTPAPAARTENEPPVTRKPSRPALGGGR